MITLLNATRLIPTPDEPVQVLNNVSAHFARGARTGILAAAGTGKSSFARLLCGIDTPDRGHVLTDGRVSWPIAYAGILHPELSGARNIDLIARSIGEDPSDILAFCASFAPDLPLSRKVKFFAPGERLALAYSLSLAVRVDHYVADEVIGFGDGVVREKCLAMLDERLSRAGLIFISRNAGQLKKLCSEFYVLSMGQLIKCPCADVAAEVLNEASDRLSHRQTGAYANVA